MLKITNNELGRAYVRDRKTGQFKNRVKTFFKKVLFWTITALLVVGAGLAIGAYARWAYPSVQIDIRETKVEVDTLTPKIEDLKDEVLNSLQSCESLGVDESDGLIVFDSNKVASIGLYQFQKKTVIYYVKTLYGKDITGKEAIELALDKDEARKLAGDIIFSTDKGIDNWYNCKNKKGLAENIKWISKISK
jgi:cell division protein FtsL